MHSAISFNSYVGAFTLLVMPKVIKSIGGEINGNKADILGTLGN